MMKVVFGILIASCLTACRATTTRSPPPIAVLVATYEDGSSRAGNGIWIGQHVLTAHHVLVEGEWALPDSLVVNGQPTRFTLEASAGYDNALAFDPSREAEYLQNRTRDWAIVRVDIPPDPNAVLPRQGDGTVKPGETLYMVGVELKQGHRTIKAIPLRVPRRKVDPTQQRPGLIYARLPRSADWSGWSGSFIGRYHKNRDQWELVGIASAMVMEAERAETSYMVIVRPPEDAIQRLFQPPASAPKADSFDRIKPSPGLWARRLSKPILPFWVDQLSEPILPL